MCVKFREFTYMLPVRKVIVSPIFWFMEVFSFQMTGIGRIKIARSRQMLGILTQMRTWVSSIQ